jgi:hypothetical protein
MRMFMAELFWTQTSVPRSDASRSASVEGEAGAGPAAPEAQPESTTLIRAMPASAKAITELLVLVLVLTMLL